MTVKTNSQEVIDALRERVSTRFATEKMRFAAHRIGLLLSSNMKSANRRVLRMPTGTLNRSLNYRLLETGEGEMTIEAGSYGVPYAAVHEFGYRGVVSIRAHIRHGNKAFGRTVKPFAANASQHSRRMNMPARPYISVGFDNSKARIVDILRGLLK
jgi:phage gpG-like protein